jgi:DNA-binding SARP family transcriptional activator
MDELWHGQPPSGAEKTLRVYVSRLRSALADEPVVARTPGCVLEVEADRIDATRFERLLREGRDALGRGAAGLAADRLGAAVALWRGPAPADVADDGTLALEAQRLDELRLVCQARSCPRSSGWSRARSSARSSAPCCARRSEPRRRRRCGTTFPPR